jgi:predicted alpha/beta hydrolase family esterase
MITTLLVPGLDGSTGGHWQQWWNETDPSAKMVSFTDLGDPVPSAMEMELVSAILEHPGCILVGHSLGAILIARILDEWPQLDVAGALLVAPAEPKDHPRIHRFDPIRERPLGVPSIAVISQNDPLMGHARAKQLARSWKAGLIDLGMAGHINLASGFGPWPLGLELRDDLLAREPRHAKRSEPQPQMSIWDRVTDLPTVSPHATR